MSDQLALRHATTVLDRSEDAILAVDPDGLVTSWNAGAVRLFGRDPRAALGVPVGRLLATEHESGSGWTDVAADAELDRARGVRRCRDGRELPVTITAVPVHDADGRVVATTMIVRDSRESARAERTRALYREEQARISAERTRASIAGELHDSAVQHVISARMRLELCIPKAAIEEGCGLEDDLRFVDGMLSSALLAMRQVMSGISALASSVDTIGAAIDAASADATDEHGLVVACCVTGRVDHPTSVAPIVHRVVLEALRNVARHAGTDGAYVQATVDDMVRVVVSDAGRGFLTDDSAGGFGFTHVAELVRRCGGTLQVESAIGAGTMVELCMPLDPTAPDDD